MNEVSDMAGDWIKMRTALAHDPAVIAMALDLDKTEFEIVGMLHHVWSWADSQSQDGHIKRVTAKWLDRFVSCEGFAKSMEMAKWLFIDSSGITFPNFDRHNGDSAKKRAEATDRKRKSRESMVTDMSHENCDENETREEKRREEKEQYQKRMSDLFAIFWKLYPKKVSKADAVKAWSKIKKAEVDLIMSALPVHCVCEQWVKDNGQYIPNAATWLNKRKWEDEVKPYVAGKNIGANGSRSLSAVDRVRAANDAAEARRRAEGSAAEVTGHLQDPPPLGDFDDEFSRIDDANGKIVGDDGRPVRP